MVSYCQLACKKWCEAVSKAIVSLLIEWVTRGATGSHLGTTEGHRAENSRAEGRGTRSSPETSLEPPNQAYLPLSFSLKWGKHVRFFFFFKLNNFLSLTTDKFWTQNNTDSKNTTITEIFCKNSLKANIHLSNNSYHCMVLKLDQEKVREKIETHLFYLMVQFFMTSPRFWLLRHWVTSSFSAQSQWFNLSFHQRI